MLLRGVNGYVIFLLHLSVWQSSVQISEILELLGYVFNPFLELFMLGLIFAFLLKQVRRLTNNLKRIFTCMSRFFVLFCPTEFTQGQTESGTRAAAQKLIKAQGRERALKGVQLTIMRFCGCTEKKVRWCQQLLKVERESPAMVFFFFVFTA